MKKVRVAPRNIHFQDTVEIREIPRDEPEFYGAEKRGSWDPYLNNVRCFFHLEITLCFVFRSKTYSKKNQQNNGMLSLRLSRVVSYFLLLLLVLFWA
jgi:hypothetical protein